MDNETVGLWEDVTVRLWEDETLRGRRLDCGKMDGTVRR